jgi:glucose/arabinose dehydrogenase
MVKAYQNDNVLCAKEPAMRSCSKLAAALLLLFPLTAAAAPTDSPPAGKTGARSFSVFPTAIFNSPWAMTFLPAVDKRVSNLALVTEREGKLWLVDVVAGTTKPVGGAPEVKVLEQGGLGDVVAHPDYASNQRIYLSYAEPGPNGTSGAAVGYGRLVLNEGAPRVEQFKVIWRQQPKVDGGAHYSHRLAFSPEGLLFISSGDRFKFDPAQELTNNLGKIVRLTAEGDPAPGNPFSSRGGAAAQIWSSGHRSVLGLAFSPDGRLWEHEMGPRNGDEVNLIERGRNYGWPVVSYGDQYDGRTMPRDHRARGFEEPKISWNPSISPAGMMVYSGALFPQWRGDMFLGGLSGKVLVRVDLNGATAREAERWDMGARIREVDQGPGGEIYLLEDGPSGGRMLRLRPAK